MSKEVEEKIVKKKEEKPCIQKRIKKILIYYSPIMGIAIISLILFRSPFPLDYNQKLNIILTFAISVFACLEAYSAYNQNMLEHRRHNIEDLRNELEKAYGVLFSILNYRSRHEKEKKTLRISKLHFEMIDNIMAKYPWMFPNEMNNLWKDTRRPVPSLQSDEIVMGREEPLYDVSIEFKEKMNTEYERRVKRYDELLEKK